MKHAKKLLAVMMVVAMIAAFSAIAFAANPKVVFTVGEYSDGKATVSAVFSDCVGLKSGNLKFAYAKDAVTKIAKKNGADVKAIGDVDNAFAHEFNSSANPAESGFYFKDVLWDSATWADAENADETVNGENFEFATFDFTAAEGTVITVTGELKIVKETAYSDGERANVRCYGADDVREGVAIMHKEGVDVSITGNSTNPTRFQHPVAGTYKKECNEQGKKYFSVASGGGTGRTLHPDNMAAGPASYGMTDTMGRMHSDAQFAGSSSVPAHVEMMGFLGMGNNPMVGATVAVAVAIQNSLK